MKTTAALFAAVLFAASPTGSAAESVTVVTELKRMRSADHLFRPQTHRILQYSGFHRQGGNPDRVFCLKT